MATSSDKIDKCEVCASNSAKYTCPKCEVRTCCLECVNIHKKELECDGIRDKTKYVPLPSFTDLDVLSDYRLLEEVGRSVDLLKRNPMKKFTREVNLPMHLNRLKTAAYKRKVILQLMPQHFSKHKDNTTYLNWKTNELFWRIEWIFPQAENTKWVTERALDSIRLASLLEEVIDPVGALENKTDIEELNLRMKLGERLQFYQAAGLSGIKVLLKAERVTKPKFYELDVTLTLNENLENKTIIEYPTLYVVLKNHSDMYEIIDSDDEDMGIMKCEPSTENPRRGRKRTTQHFNKKQDQNSAVNYFFDANFSESDDEKMSNTRESKPISGFNIVDYDQLVKMEQ